MNQNTLRIILEHAESWAEEDRQELADYARVIEARRTDVYRVTQSERSALTVALEQADRRRFRNRRHAGGLHQTPRCMRFATPGGHSTTGNESWSIRKAVAVGRAQRTHTPGSGGGASFRAASIWNSNRHVRRSRSVCRPLSLQDILPRAGRDGRNPAYSTYGKSPDRPGIIRARDVSGQGKGGPREPPLPRPIAFTARRSCRR